MIFKFIVQCFCIKNAAAGIKLKAYFILIAFFLFQQIVNGQSNVYADSLKNLLNRTKSVEEKLRLTIQLSEEFYKPNPTLALLYAKQSEQLANQINSDSMLNKAYVNQATSYLHMGNYPHALQLYFKAIPGAQKLGDSYTLFSIYERMGILYHFENDNNNALKYFFQALKQFSLKKPENKKQTERKAALLKNIGIVFNETKKYDESAQYFNEALNLARQLNDHELIANVINDQASLYLNLGKSDLAFKQFKEAMEIRKKYNDEWGLTRSYLNIGQFYLTRKDYKSAEAYLKDAIALGKKVQFWQNVNTASLYLFQLYKEKGDLSNALNTLELNKTVNDTLYDEERTRKIGQLETQFEFERKQLEFEVKQREKNLYYWLAGVTLGLSLIIVTLLFYLQKNKTRNVQLEQAHLTLEKIELERNIELKDKELTTNILQLIQKNELIEEVSEKLYDYKRNASEESQLVIQKVLADLQSNLHPELLQEFEFRFQQVHQEFFNILNEKYPNLSPSERRLCAFLKLNMTTKEISAITYQSTKSIEIARTRLRKKLNLTGTDLNLVNFLIQLDAKN
ncbi:tetratricopeptide repeat protein [Pedobacter nyackensis]|uniref:tetratricopeptide repeat protein n=1 Tax=Pedobacter nyackensis TaxID=475255 RepID=UPI002931EB2C|nr:tetratricopeptide repeat protein [Pedobacter nyackensis]